NEMTKQVAFLFPGQGSQVVGMGADIYAASEAARNVFRTFDETLGFPLSEICFDGPEDTLRSTINAQAAIVAVSLAYLAAFQESLSSHDSHWSLPLIPSYTAGHSVGEATALVPAGAANLKDIAYLVRERGRLMHEAGTACPGGMAAIIGMDEEILQEICREATQQIKATLGTTTQAGEGEVTIANYNAPGQIVISGDLRALEVATALAEARGATRAIPLSVSGAFHSPIMASAADKLARFIINADIHDAVIPIISNITATPLTQSIALRNELAQQLATPVQWVRTIEYLTSVGITTFFEIGPGRALAGMIKRIARGAKIINIGNVAEVEKAAAFVREAGLLQ
ncbi:MAG TPA: ACP S-malonyltransferase, partial [Ktedonobacteraceae bacterium]